MEKLVPHPFIKNKNSAYLWIKSLKPYKVSFYCISKSNILKPKYIKTKMLTTSYYLLGGFFKIKKKSGTSLPSSFSA